MTRYAAFLRGVNVGGVNLKMAAVAESWLHLLPFALPLALWLVSSGERLA